MLTSRIEASGVFGVNLVCFGAGRMGAAAHHRSITSGRHLAIQSNRLALESGVASEPRQRCPCLCSRPDIAALQEPAATAPGLLTCDCI